MVRFSNIYTLLNKYGSLKSSLDLCCDVGFSFGMFDCNTWILTLSILGMSPIAYDLLLCYVYILGVCSIAHELCWLFRYIGHTPMHMFYYLVYDYICWDCTLMDKEYCRDTMYYIYYCVISIYIYWDVYCDAMCRKMNA